MATFSLKDFHWTSTDDRINGLKTDLDAIEQKDRQLQALPDPPSTAIAPITSHAAWPNIRARHKQLHSEVAWKKWDNAKLRRKAAWVCFWHRGRHAVYRALRRIGRYLSRRR